MPNDARVNNSDDDFARQLKQLVPAAEPINRDDLLYRAGYRTALREARRRQRWLVGATCLLAAATSFLAIERGQTSSPPNAPLAAQHDAPNAQVDEAPARSGRIDRVASDAATVTQPAAPELSPSSHFVLRRQLADAAAWRDQPTPSYSTGWDSGIEPTRWHLEREFRRSGSSL